MDGTDPFAMAVVVFLIVLVFLGVALHGQSRDIEAYAEEQQGRAAEKRVRLRAIDSVIEAHVRTLARKRAQMLRADDYGNPTESGENEWKEERKYFIKTVIWKDGDCGYVPFPTLMQQVEDRVIEHLEEADDSRLYDSDADLSGVEYEQYCAGLLERSGWSVRLTAGSGDQGVDIFAERDGKRLVIQCKMYSSPVGNKAVQEAVAARGFERADFAAVVSNARYTPAAKQLAAANGVMLLHHSDLVDLWSSISPNDTEA